MAVRRSHENIPALSQPRESHTCTICHEANEEAEWTLTTCRHQFHLRCLTTLLETNATCPLCRRACTRSELGNPEAGEAELPPPFPG